MKEQGKNMNVKIDSKTIKEKYPVLKQTNDVVVLFTKKDFGTLLTKSDKYDVSQTEWYEYKFELFTGSITLSND